MTTPPSIALSPVLPASLQGLLNSFITKLYLCNKQKPELLKAIHEHRNLLTSHAPNDRDRYSGQVFFDILEDLVKQEWTFDAIEGTIHAIAPDTSRGNPVEHDEIKKRLQVSLVAARNEQLQEDATKRFVFDMERPRWWEGQQVSVQNLFVNPQTFAEDLDKRLHAPKAIREQLLRDAIQPYIQFVTEGRDVHTNLRLVDIWRYCRYTWSLPFHNTPGRRMQYLIRDAARDFHPIIGIGALGSSMMQITKRDDKIGWTIASLKKAENLPERVAGLAHEIETALQDIYWQDLLDPEDVAQPSENTIEKLTQRIEKLTEQHGFTSRMVVPDKHANLLDMTKSPLYTRKRAVVLLDLLKARFAFQQAAQEMPDAPHKHLMSTHHGRLAIKAALREVKKRHVGASMMDITTCGALPPYNHLLGGKLVSLLMASPQIVADYAKRYQKSESVIASRMKGTELVRPSHLVLLATTSLYGIGSSQYNRLKAPTAKGELKYETVGVTEGYGSVHLSYRTYTSIQQLLRSHPNHAHSYSFAAGVNYKLRSIATALHMLGISVLADHKNPRLIYLVPLARNWQEYLTGQHDHPESIYAEVKDPAQETQKLIEYWKDRWYLKRLQRPEVLYAIRTTNRVKVSNSVVVDQPLFEETVPR